MLLHLKEKGVKSVIVTHSPKEQVDLICANLPILQTIMHRITREDYKEPKPSSECYELAIQCYGDERDRIIGFEDSLRGLFALKGTRALPIWICSKEHPLFSHVDCETIHFETFSSIPTSFHPHQDRSGFA